MNSSILIALSALLSVSIACRCVRQFTVEQHFCDSDFMIEVEVNSERQSNASITNDLPFYVIRIRHIFKANDTIRDVLLTEKKLWTSPTSCAIWLNKYHDYIVGGRFTDNKPNIFGCDFARQPNTLDEEQKKFFYRKKYQTIQCPNKP